MAFNSVKAQREIITFGIKPDRPETGYGYVAFGQEVEPNVYQRVRFVLKARL